MRSDSIESQLTHVRQRLEALPEAEEPPPTTLQVLGRSRREGYWQRLLVHFLTPDAAHGLEHAVLEHFLSGLRTHPDVDFDFSRLDLGDINIEMEVSTSQGRPDVLIWSAEEWFLCIELKVDSTEGIDQTTRYVSVDSFDGVDVSKQNVPKEGHQYVYLTPENAAPPGAEEFTPVSWEWVASELQSFVSNSYGEYPFKTTVQLSDFIDTIRNELTMTEYQENRQEKVALAVEYYEPITDVFDALEEYTEDLQTRWPDWFHEQSPDGWDEHWQAPETSNSYLKVHRDDWAIEYDPSNISESGLFIYWEFRVTERHIGQSRVQHQIIVTGDDDQLTEAFRKRFYDEDVQEQVSDLLTEIRTDSEKEASLQDWQNHTYENILAGEYQFEFQGDEGFAETVSEAFSDLQPVFEHISDSVPGGRDTSV